ncbi:MAG: hypothetical protein HC831_29370 [Chloroflexia bacterium]|nr:hypothetical protein [Chloroflexia bacterium]
MTPIFGKPLIDYIIKYLSSFDFIKEIIIISDYQELGGQIKNYFSHAVKEKNHICTRLTKWNWWRPITH